MEDEQINAPEKNQLLLFFLSSFLPSFLASLLLSSLHHHRYYHHHLFLFPRAISQRYEPKTRAKSHGQLGHHHPSVLACCFDLGLHRPRAVPVMVAVFYHWRELPQVAFLSRQKHIFCRDKSTLVATKYLSRDKTFVATHLILSLSLSHT